ncbi:MAG: hypothetical protein CL778_01550 [Chloroflexi bacterium]|nr:hypothetical protein [Chloroflexota bacterium]|tara:strand:+ start:198 stop:872 length:675 start_codon:yes stop_codon:yes gene_type:complete
MYIIIGGGGNISEEIASSLLSSGDEVHVIDIDENIIEKINSNLGIIGSVGTLTNIRDLEKSGIGRAAMFIAASDNDEDNLVACQLVKHNFETSETVSIYKYMDNYEVFQQSGIDHPINLTELTINRLSSIINTHAAVSLIELPGRDKGIISVKVPPNSQVLGLTIKEIPFVQETKVLMVASENGEIHDNLQEYKLSARDELIIRVPNGLESEIHTIITTNIYEK